MKIKLLVILGVYLIFHLIIANASEGASLTGYDWQKYSTTSKGAFILGWGICGKSATDNMPILMGSADKMNESIEYINMTEDNFREAGVIFSGTTVGQVVDTIDQIYSDPRVKSMEIIDVMPFVSGRLTQGWTMKELDEVIAITVQIKRCEIEKGAATEGCATLRKRKISLLAKLRNKTSGKNNSGDNSSCESKCQEMYYAGELKKGLSIKQCIDKLCNGEAW